MYDQTLDMLWQGSILKNGSWQFEQSHSVILSEAKDLGPASEILRFAQDDTV